MCDLPVAMGGLAFHGGRHNVDRMFIVAARGGAMSLALANEPYWLGSP